MDCTNLFVLFINICYYISISPFYFTKTESGVFVASKNRFRVFLWTVFCCFENVLFKSGMLAGSLNNLGKNPNNPIYYFNFVSAVCHCYCVIISQKLLLFQQKDFEEFVNYIQSKSHFLLSEEKQVIWSFTI